MVALLRCSRQSLGIMASSRGAVIGRLLIQVKEFNWFYFNLLYAEHFVLDLEFDVMEGAWS